MHLFLYYEPETILQTLFILAFPKDKFIWHLTTNGIYTVNSGYKVGMSYMSSGGRYDGTSSVDQEAKLWNSIYQLTLQPKVRIFLWRASLNILPTGTNLMRRSMYNNLGCSNCEFHIEDDRHALFECYFAKKYGLSFL